MGLGSPVKMPGNKGHVIGKPMDLCAVPRTIRTEILPSTTCPSGVVLGELMVHLVKLFKS